MGEGEIILERNSEFEIEKVEIIDSKCHVYLRMLPNLLEKGVKNPAELEITDEEGGLELEYEDVFGISCLEEPEEDNEIV